MSSSIQPGLDADVAVQRLLERHGGQLFALGLRLCGSREDAEELVQDTMVSAWRHWDSFRGDAKPSTWLWTIAARACRRKKRRKAGEPQRLASLSDLAPFDEPFVADLGAPDAEATRERARESLRAAILELPAEFRLPLVMRDVLELPAPEVARALGLQETTVRTRVHRARLRLRKALQRELPRRRAPAPAFDRELCMDLLRAKLAAQDSGRAFRIPGNAACDRCATIFAELDLAKEACALLGDAALPDDVRRRVLGQVLQAPAPRRGRER